MQAVIHMFYQKSIKPTQTSTELENFDKELWIFSPVLTFLFEYFVQMISKWIGFDRLTTRLRGWLFYRKLVAPKKTRSKAHVASIEKWKTVAGALKVRRDAAITEQK